MGTGDHVKTSAVTGAASIGLGDLRFYFANLVLMEQRKRIESYKTPRIYLGN